MNPPESNPRMKAQGPTFAGKLWRGKRGGRGRIGVVGAEVQRQKSQVHGLGRFSGLFWVVSLCFGLFPTDGGLAWTGPGRSQPRAHERSHGSSPEKKLRRYLPLFAVAWRYRELRFPSRRLAGRGQAPALRRGNAPAIVVGPAWIHLDSPRLTLTQAGWPGCRIPGERGDEAGGMPTLPWARPAPAKSGSDVKEPPWCSVETTAPPTATPERRSDSTFIL
jgi:hypothetical protein